MDSLIAKADAIQPVHKRRNNSKRNPAPRNGPSKHAPQTDSTLSSITHQTALPRSLRPSSPLPENAPTHNHVPNKKLRAELSRQSAQSIRRKQLIEDAAELLLVDDAGKMEVEGEMERTWRMTQEEICREAGAEAAKGRREWKLDGGPYRARYTRNGRHIAVMGRKGHVATFDWQTGTLHTELQLQETCRDIAFLHSHTHFAVAQQKHVFVYDQDGVELHKLKSHVEATRLEYLDYHWLLASISTAGHLQYLDATNGQIVAVHQTTRHKLGTPISMTKNPHNAVIHLGHQNGVVSLWTPNLPHPAVRLLAHLGPVQSVSVSIGSQGEGGRYMATAGKDGMVKVWDCRNWKGAVRSWRVRSAGDAEVEFSQRGMLAVASGGSVNVYTKPTLPAPNSPPPLYLTHPITHKPTTSIRFCPFQDILTVGHEKGLSSILVPGAGEPNFDSSEADPFENKRGRREREVKGLLDKIPADMIALDPDFVGSLGPSGTKEPDEGVPFARLPRLQRLKIQGKADETEVDADGGDGEGNDGDGDGAATSKASKEKMKMRGRNKALKRYLRKQRKNVIDPKAIAVRQKLEREREERRKEREKARLGPAAERKPSALDRFASNRR
ncbi:BING4CT-domain-containing protein [Heliocybe sulcata]|uniref:U three protein 7 n=1 Tax=Heliocybe sulcata TaxID=5364 RepID=A0A5C3MIU8_9AGAM|nr:BING4CT-domain-containing protein [Heliocybe sulcata]